MPTALTAPASRAADEAKNLAQPTAVTDPATERRIWFEGEWIEGAVEQKRAELSARRAHKEAVKHLKARWGSDAEVTPYDSSESVVTTLDTADRYLVLVSVRSSTREKIECAVEVERLDSEKWQVVP